MIIGKGALQDSPDSSPFDVAGRTEQQKTALLYDNCTVTQIVTLVEATALALVNCLEGAPLLTALLWWLAIFAITGARVLLARSYRHANSDARAHSHWRQRFIAGLLCGSLAWGSGAVLFAWHAPEGARLFTGLILAGLVAGAVPALAPVPGAFRLFAVPVLAPLAIIVLWRGHTVIDYAFGSSAAVFLVAVLSTARRWHGSMDMAIRLGFEQHRLAQVVQASEERYRLILQYSPAGIFHYDSGLRITFCNDRLAQIMGADRPRIIGLQLNQLSDQRLLPALRAALEGRDGTYEGEYLATLSAVRLWVSLSCTPYRDASGQVQGGVAILQDVTERRRTQEEIHQLAYFDPLTRLPNRRLLMDRLGQALSASARSGQFGALIILDLDQFKRINDSQGHDIGDRMLIEAARRLAVCMRREDTVARFGGDEFIVILEGLGTSESAAISSGERIAEQLRATLEAPYDLGDSDWQHYSSVSIGLTLFRGDQASCELLRSLGHPQRLRAAEGVAAQCGSSRLAAVGQHHARLFHEAGFVEELRHALQTNGANPRLLNLELTESVVLADVDSVVAKMQQLRDLGVNFSLDDFGQGYSSLSYLKRLPLQQVKIDQAFVRGLPFDPSDVAIVRAILAMGESLELTVVAEGVETAAQKEFLLLHGCRIYQGFLFCPPVPGSQFESYVLEQQGLLLADRAGPRPQAANG
jgi:diguanylate cyclase (GGDEF)-like protein/PAS domain S-box-containing protein